MPITDLTGYTWVGNDTLNITNSTELSYNVNGSLEFGNGGSSGTFTTLAYQLAGRIQIPTLTVDDTMLYSGSWSDPNEVSITFTGGTDATNPTLIAWLEANGTLTAPQPTVNPYLTFSSPNSFTLSVVDNIKYWDGTLEYSTDLSTWNTWSGTSAVSSVSDGTKHNLYLRGTGNTKITGSSASSTKAHWVLTGSNISCEGNIENLLDYTTVALGNHPTMLSYCYCYMFYNCTSLTSAPELPAITLTAYCYRAMFSNCTGLTTTPSLPATTLANRCYNRMFQGCTSLTTAPTLPATTLVADCYQQMFQGCTSLTTAPTILPATTLAYACYNAMFYGCTSLASAPTLPATKLYDYCYFAMFYGCTNVKLSTTQTGNYTKAYRLPTSGTGKTASDALTDMFSHTGGTFTGTPSINTTYYLYVEPEPSSPGMSFGNLPINKMLFGNLEVSAVYYGNVKIYEASEPPTPTSNQ